MKKFLLITAAIFALFLLGHWASHNLHFILSGGCTVAILALLAWMGHIIDKDEASCKKN